MKNIFKLLTLVIVLLVAAGCTEKPFWYNGYTGEGDVYAQLTSDYFDFGLYMDAEGVPVTDESFPISVKLLGPAQSTDVNIGLTVTSSTGDNGEWTITNYVATVPAGSLNGSVMITINKDVAVLDSVYTLEIEIDEATTDIPLYTNGGTSCTVDVYTGLSCAFIYDMFNGTYYYETIWSYEPNPTATIVADEDAETLTSTSTWDEMGPNIVVLDVTGDEVGTNMYELTGEDQITWNGDLTSWGLGTDCDFSFEDINSGVAYSCTGEFVYKATPYLYDNTSGSAYWWGGEMEFVYHVGSPSKKASLVARPVGNFEPKLQPVL